MPTWICPKCGAGVSSAFERNLELLVYDHKKFACALRNAPLERLTLTPQDLKFLEEVGIAVEITQ